MSMTPERRVLDWTWDEQNGWINGDGDAALITEILLLDEIERYESEVQRYLGMYNDLAVEVLPMRVEIERLQAEARWRDPVAEPPPEFADVIVAMDMGDKWDHDVHIGIDYRDPENGFAGKVIAWRTLPAPPMP